MEISNLFFKLALILFATKIFGLLTRKFHLPQVVGAIAAGIILGPAILGVIVPSEIITIVAEIGVVLLMFTAGLETDFKQLQASLKATFIIAVLGIIIPIGGGFALAYCFGQDVLKSVFIGVILTATSVSITVETLHEMGKLKTRAGTAILGAAVIDDVLGIIILSVVMGTSDDGSVSIAEIGLMLLKIIGFFALALIFGVTVFKVFKYLIIKKGIKKRVYIFALVFCFFMAFLAEQFGIANIIGAYFAGLILCNIPSEEAIEEKSTILSYMFFSPIFFFSVGLMTTFEGLDKRLVLFAVLLLAVAILSKLAGCFLGAVLCKYTKKESLQIGVGMISRGEVAIIVATLGVNEGHMVPELFSSVIVVVIITTLITPLLLNLVFRKDEGDMNTDEVKPSTG
ncbi:MAG: cation:proton antiporter [Oscillospiraceae bacterium]|nr:cation:proton antiporter [Oscillospiraceae bacterium]